MNFSEKKIAILGFGLEGEDLCQFLIDQNAKITVFDKKKPEELNNIIKFEDKGIIFQLGKSNLEGILDDFDIIFRSPGFYRYLPAIVSAEKNGAIISSATKLFFDLCPSKIIGVTGTKGKGTTSTLIYNILKESGKNAYLAGNIGQTMLSLLGKLAKDDFVVLELSSFQLIDLEKSPHIAVVLNIAQDHLDWHKDEEEYLMAKENIVRWQSENDFAVLNMDYDKSKKFSEETKAKTYFFSRVEKVEGAFYKEGALFLNINGEMEIGKTSNLLLRGEHNFENILAASCAASLAGADLKSIKEAVFSFKGLEHRLELVKEINGIKYYNDSFSTTPDTCIAAIKSFNEPIILIAGGSEKGADYTQLGEEISKSKIKTLILIGEMAGRIEEAVKKADYQGEIIMGQTGMTEIVKKATELAKSGEIVLLSPACASFGLFKNYKDRGNQFKESVELLK